MRILLAAACLVALHAGAGAAEPVIGLPTLEAQPSPPAPAGGGDGARRLPPTVTVCRDAPGHRCWLADAGCGSAEEFRTVIAGPDRPDAAAAVEDCRRTLE